METDAIRAATRDLGGRLAALREAAGYTQASLARLVGYSRSTVANAEAGQPAARQFWQMCDEVLGGSVLVGMSEEIRALHRERQEEAREAARRRREDEARRWRHEVARAPTEPGPPRDNLDARARTLTGLPSLSRLSSWALLIPALEPHMVDRSTDLDTLVSLLTDASQPGSPSRLGAS